MIRIISVLLILLFTTGLITSCADRNDETHNDQDTLSTTSETVIDDTSSNLDARGYIKDNLPEDLNFNDEEITILYWSDYTMDEFFVSGINGELVNDAIYERNRAVEERLKVKLAYYGQKGYEKNSSVYIQMAENDIKSGLAEYDIFACYSKTIAAMSLKGDLADLMSANYIDFDMPWWPKSLLKECIINDMLYFCSGDISTNMLWMMIGTFFNVDMLESYSLENPYDLVASNRWTMDKLIAMTSDIYNDNNGDYRKSDGDTLGFIIYNENIDAFLTSAGIKAIEKDESGELIISPSYHGEKIVNLIGKIGSFFANSPGTMYSSSIYIRDNFFNENVLMTMDRVFIVAGKDNRDYNTKIEFKYGIVPNAKYSETDEFYTNIGHPFTMYAISNALSNTDLAGAVLECLASESYRQVTPAVFEETMKIRYTYEGVAAQMYDIIRSTVVFDLGRLYATNFSNYTSDLFRQQVMSNSTNYISKYKAVEKTIIAGIENIKKAYSK